MKQIILIVLLYFTSSGKLVCQDKINNALKFTGKNDLHQSNHTHHTISLKFASVHRENKYYVTDLFNLNHPDSLFSLIPATVVVRKTNGDTLITAQYRRNNLHGKWMSWYKPGQLCDSGRLDKGIPHGEWKTFYPNGNLRYIRNYNAFLFRKIKNDIIRENRYSFYAIAAMFKKNPVAVVKHFNADYSFNNHTSKEGHLSLPERVKHNTSAQRNYLPPFLESLHHGPYINYYHDGAIRDSGYYKNGFREGIWEEWAEDRKIRKTGVYRHGQKAGTWKYYSSRGKLITLKEFNSKGEEIYSKQF